MNKKIILWLLLIFWCSVIFFFSSQQATQSSSLSGHITKVVADVIDNIKKLSIPAFSELKHLDKEKLMQILETVIRKSAHFSIFAVLGAISFSLSECYFKRKPKIFAISFLFCVLYAFSDEFHQLFVPGRSGNILDVLIDSSGALVGNIFVMCFAQKVFRKRVKPNIIN